MEGRSDKYFHPRALFCLASATGIVFSWSWLNIGSSLQAAYPVITRAITVLVPLVGFVFLFIGLDKTQQNQKIKVAQRQSHRAFGISCLIGSLLTGVWLFLHSSHW